jgi:hypothetical protein
VLVALEPLTFPVALACLAHAWIIPELYAYRGASVLRPKGPRNERAEPVAQGLLGDLLGHEARERQRATGLALERGKMGAWLVGEAGALLLPAGGNHVHCFCVRATDREPTSRASRPWPTTPSAAPRGECAAACPWGCARASTPRGPRRGVSRSFLRDWLGAASSRGGA